jgi:hypothetical protein
VPTLLGIAGPVTGGEAGQRDPEPPLPRAFPVAAMGGHRHLIKSAAGGGGSLRVRSRYHPALFTIPAFSFRP